jgi:hypothetical protein
MIAIGSVTQGLLVVVGAEAGFVVF